MPRRPVIDDAGRSRSIVPWLGIASWLLLCGALFASLVGWPSQTALDRVTGIWTHDAPESTWASRPAPNEPTSPDASSTPAREQDWSDMTRDAPQDQEALPPTELAPPIRSAPSSDTVERTPGGPPLPRFKPRVDRVAAKFSNAFFEIGNRLQQQGDLDGAVHMRRQGTNLDPWKTAGPSDL
jgi:hypothetical protein